MRRVVLLALVVPLLVACGDSKDDYCDAVSEHQKHLSEVLGSGKPDAMLQALDTFQDLADQAPSDITDEWQQVNSSIEKLQQALDDAGVDPSTYDRDKPPAGLTADQKKAIDAAAARLGGAETLEALKDLDQQARDVCHTPLTL
ncbi:hypothetical protein [Nocardioides conyzicola]|uniref:Lipoprotein n=1 Tax=Nocardioides conyzicola TaxID=1651781 RepID=A0ABP8XRE6_9ACTN